MTRTQIMHQITSVIQAETVLWNDDPTVNVPPLAAANEQGFFRTKRGPNDEYWGTELICDVRRPDGSEIPGLAALVKQWNEAEEEELTEEQIVEMERAIAAATKPCKQDPQLQAKLAAEWRAANPEGYAKLQAIEELKKKQG